MVRSPPRTTGFSSSCWCCPTPDRGDATWPSVPDGPAAGWLRIRGPTERHSRRGRDHGGGRPMTPERSASADALRLHGMETHVLERLKAAAVLVDLRGTIIYVNPAAELMYGI